LKGKFTEMLDKYDFLLDVRGEGLLLGLQLAIPGAEIVKKCLDRGLLINCTAGTVLRFIPPLNISREEADEFLSILTSVLDEIKL
jgi:acetylornithine/succinyldiaminopimelate/putrescine aminotransferase